MARRIARHDWAATPLGPIAGWPECLRHTISLMLPSHVPLVLLWGEAGVMIYNDAYAVFAGARDSRLLGSNVREGWDEVADFNDNVMRVGLAGGTLSYKDHELTLHRSGQPEQVFMNLDYSPVRDEAGRPMGVIAVVVETTEAWHNREALEESARKLGFLDELGRAIATSRDADVILTITTRMVGEHLGCSNCAYADMDDDEDGFTIRGNWHRADARSLVGHYRLATFGARAVTDLKAGRPLVIRDAWRELPAHEAQTFADMGIAAVICMPLVKEGRLIGLMAVHDNAPRDWSDYEQEMIREVTERSWAHVERVSIEADLRASAGALQDLNETLESRVDERSRQLLEVEAALRQSHKMEAVGQMTGGLAHDFNNLLTAIGGALETISARIAQGRTHDLDRYFSAANGAVRRAAALTHRLLAFSRQQTLDPQPTRVGQLLGELEDLLRRTLGPAISLDLAIADDAWPACIDRNQLENAVLNLCINARDAMPQGGELTIAVDNCVLDAADAAGLGAPPGDYLAIAVRDNGSGMASAVRERAFDPFFTTKPLGKGTGLGLSMVYGFVRQSGGDVQISSAEGRGTTVRLLLPRHPDAVSDDTPAEEVPAAPASGGGRTVLVTEDEFIIRMMIAEALEEAGYRVLEADDAPSALELLAAGEQIDLLVTDVGLPNGMNGRQLADAARERLPGLRVLFITGYAESAIVGPGGFERGTAVLTKPFDMAGIAAKVTELLAR